MKGFTLIELLLVIGMMAIVAGMSVPFFQTFQVSSDLYTNTNTIVKTLDRARQQAISGQNNSDWGVYFANDVKKVILFKGSNYASRQVDYDQEIVYSKPFNLTADFGSEVSFSVYSGKASKTGTISLSSQNNETKKIIIKDLGLIQIDNGS
ncbi:MAG: prepilin-type N-terminal cleavage/methylation domain-containing protein [Candidatus Buchananbacteria bacterium]